MSRATPSGSPGRVAADRTVLRAGTPADLLTLVPYLLGFHPDESLVVLSLHGKRVSLTARIDLPGSAGLPDDRGAWRPTLDHLLTAVRRQRPTSVAMVGYSARPEAVRTALRTAIEALADDAVQPIPVAEAVRTDGHRWWSALCTDQRCCPAAGTPFQPQTNRLAAEAVYAGLAALPDRDQLRASVAGPGAADEPGLLAQLAAAKPRLAELSQSERRRRMQTLVELGTHLCRGAGSDEDPRSGGSVGSGPSEPLPVTALLELAALTADVTVRDVAWAVMTPETAFEHVRLWQSVVMVTPARAAVAPLCLAGAAAWIAGQGALLVCAVQRALELEPHYSLAGLLSGILDQAVPPSMWDEIAGPLRRELGLG